VAKIGNIFKVAELRNKILFTLAMLLIYRLGVSLRVPGVDAQAVSQLREASKSQGALGFLNLFSGGAFGSFSIFALGIMPYITSSIIMQVLTVVIPKLEQWQQEGATGQRKITQWTRYVAIGIATLQGAGLTFIFGQGRGSAFFGASTQAPDVVLLDPFMPRALLVIPSLVAGTALLMWLGELISQRGIGNGMSMVIFASVVSDLPYSYYSLLQSRKTLVFIILIARRVRAAKIARAICKTCCRSQDVRWAKYLYSVEGQPVGCSANHFRKFSLAVASFDVEHVGQW
jgi:preprotein translocase subunit SecY